MVDGVARKPLDEVHEMIVTLADPSTSDWLKQALTVAVERDPFDAERDALRLVALLTRRVDALVERLYPSG